MGGQLTEKNAEEERAAAFVVVLKRVALVEESIQAILSRMLMFHVPVRCKVGRVRKRVAEIQWAGCLVHRRSWCSFEFGSVVRCVEQVRTSECFELGVLS